METAQGVKNIFFEHRKKPMRNAYLAVYGIVHNEVLRDLGQVKISQAYRFVPFKGIKIVTKANVFRAINHLIRYDDFKIRCYGEKESVESTMKEWIHAKSVLGIRAILNIITPSRNMTCLQEPRFLSTGQR